MTTWLVTGGAGFIGGNFVLRAVHEGIRVVNLDALTYAGNRDTLGDGKPMKVGGSWHSDHSHQQNAPRGTMLHALQLPSHGGDT